MQDIEAPEDNGSSSGGASESRDVYPKEILTILEKAMRIINDEKWFMCLRGNVWDLLDKEEQEVMHSYIDAISEDFRVNIDGGQSIEDIENPLMSMDK